MADDKRQGHSKRVTSANLVKTCGYLVSVASVVLLAIVSWKAASADPFLMACLIAGAAASILGMLLRWASYQMEK